MEKHEIQEKLEEGWIRINMMFEMVGNPKEHIVNTLKSYMSNIRTDSGVEIISEDYEEPEELEKNLFTTFVESDMLVKDLEKLTWLCFNFTPASIEIVDPANINVKNSDLQNWMNDLLAKLHEVGAISKQISSQNKLMIKNMNRLIKNSVLMCTGMGLDTPKEMEEKIGIPYKQLKPFIEALMREGKMQVHEEQSKAPKKASSKKKSKKKSSEKKAKKKK